MLQSTCIAFFVCMWLMHKRMGRNREFLSELKLVFHEKNDSKKDANIDIFKHTFYSEIKSKAFQQSTRYFQRGIETNMKQKEQFVSEFLMTEQSTLEKVQKTTIKHTGYPGNAGGISKRVLLKSSIKKRKKTIEKREVC